MPTEVTYTVQELPGWKDSTFALMRGCVVIARYVDPDVAYRLADALNAARINEA